MSISIRELPGLGVEAKVYFSGGCFHAVGRVETSSPDLSAIIDLLLFALSEMNALFIQLNPAPFPLRKEGSALSR
jgi:hypothetical protein